MGRAWAGLARHSPTTSAWARAHSQDKLVANGSGGGVLGARVTARAPCRVADHERRRRGVLGARVTTWASCRVGRGLAVLLRRRRVGGGGRVPGPFLRRLLRQLVAILGPGAGRVFGRVVGRRAVGKFTVPALRMGLIRAAGQLYARARGRHALRDVRAARGASRVRARGLLRGGWLARVGARARLPMVLLCCQAGGAGVGGCGWDGGAGRACGGRELAAGDSQREVR